MKRIDIDFDVHKLIEAERRGFGEPENSALRRLLSLPELDCSEAAVLEKPAGRPFHEDGATVPHGSEARMLYQYGRQKYDGQFLDGSLVVNGNSYATLSAAASDLARTKSGKRTNLNGWLYWEVRFPDSSDWVQMEDLRKETRTSA